MLLPEVSTHTSVFDGLSILGGSSDAVPHEGPIEAHRDEAPRMIRPNNEVRPRSHPSPPPASIISFSSRLPFSRSSSWIYSTTLGITAYATATCAWLRAIHICWFLSQNCPSCRIAVVVDDFRVTVRCPIRQMSNSTGTQKQYVTLAWIVLRRPTTL